MVCSVQLLGSALPSWFAPAGSPSADELVGVARPPETLWEAGGIELRFRPNGPTVAVSETVVGAQLPERCPERHIQWDHTFCLGLKPVAVWTEADARLWWVQLGQWLQLQSIAAQTGRWPPEHARDHGDAGALQEAALELAAELDLEADYLVAHADEPSWISDPTPRVVAVDGKPINGLRPCPRDCRAGTAGQRRVLWKDCPRRCGLAQLISLERQRRRALQAYWTALRSAGATCCGTMAACPLRIDAGPPSRAGRREALPGAVRRKPTPRTKGGLACP